MNTTHYKDMSVPDFIVEMEERGVELRDSQGGIAFRARPGALDEDARDYISLHKQECLDYLAKERLGLAGCLEGRAYAPERRYPLTDIQHAYLLGRSDIPYGGLPCQIYLELSYPKLDTMRVQEIWRALQRRHQMLRARFDADGCQWICEAAAPLSISVLDLRNRDAACGQRELATLRERMAHRVFGLSHESAFEVCVSKHEGFDLLHLTIEFIIADWTSIWLLLGEFEEAYRTGALHSNPPELSFPVYVEAYQEYRQGISYARDRHYWLERIDGLPAAPALPTVRDANLQGGFSRLSLEIEPLRYQAFKDACTHWGVTPTAAVAAVYAATLERWSVAPEFCLNLTVLNRQPVHERIGEVVGDFTSTSLLEVRWRTDVGLGANARELASRLFEDMEHPLFSGVEVIRELARRRGQRESLMPYVLTSALGLTSRGILGTMTSSCISQTPQVFIDCQAMDGPFGLRVNWDVRTGVFHRGMVEDMFESFRALLGLACDKPQAWEGPADIELPSWQRGVIEAANATNAPITPSLLHADLLERIKEQPREVAVVDEARVWTYGEVGHIAAGIARRLRLGGCRPGDRVAVCMGKSTWQVASALAVLVCEAAYVPLDPTAHERLVRVVGEAGIRTLLTVSDEPAAVEGCSTIEVDLVEQGPLEELATSGNPDAVAYVIYTSGSTGAPKGVVITHRAAHNTIVSINGRYGMGVDDVALGLSQLTFDLSVYDIFGVLGFGGTLVYPQRARYTDPSHWYELARRWGVTVWNSVPAFMQMLVNYLVDEGLALPDLRLAMLSGDWIPLDLFDRMADVCPRARRVSLGGATEASIWSVAYEYQRKDPSWTSIPYGFPLENQRLYVLDHAMRECPVHVRGDLYIAGAGLAQGYLAREDLTSAAFVTHPRTGERLYRTGDLAVRMPDGCIEFCGRADSQVKVQGFRIELGEVNAALLDYPSIDGAAACVLGGRDADRSLYAVASGPGLSGAGGRDEERRILAYLSDRLPRYMVPKRLFFVSAIPLSANGKVDLKTVGRIVEAALAQDADAAHASYADKVEKAIAGFVDQALGTKAVDPVCDLYDLGANSLIMGAIAGRVSAAWPDSAAFEDVLVTLLNTPTVRSVADLVRSRS